MLGAACAGPVRARPPAIAAADSSARLRDVLFMNGAPPEIPSVRGILSHPSANRDEDLFPDGDVFDITRSPNEHIAFGGRGPHYCLGTALAKMEIKVLPKK